MLDAVVIRGSRGPRRPENCCLDKGYDYPNVLPALRLRGILAHLRRRGEPPLVGAVRGKPRRWVVERTNSWHNRFAVSSYAGNDAAPTTSPSFSYDSRYADLLFEVVTRRYDAQKPVFLSTNKAFSEWSEVFPHAACVVTLVDRLIHRAEVVEIEAESYRLKEAKELNAARTKRRGKRTDALFTGELHRQSAFFTGELHRIPAVSRDRQHFGPRRPKTLLAELGERLKQIAAVELAAR